MSDSQGTSITGRVKWFNNKAGYGFITITDGDRTGTDVFVHHTRVIVESEQYKYLVQGEYVEFKVQKVEDKAHENQATCVKGIMSGDLMCETRHKNKSLNDAREPSERRHQRRHTNKLNN